MKRSLYILLSCIAMQSVSFGSLFAMKVIEDQEFGTITISKKDAVIIATAQIVHNKQTAFFTSVKKMVGTTDFTTESYQFNPNAPETKSPVMVRAKLTKLLRSHIALLEKEEQENLPAPAQPVLHRTNSYTDLSTLVLDQEVHIEFPDKYEQWRSSSPALVESAQGREILSQSN